MTDTDKPRIPDPPESSAEDADTEPVRYDGIATLTAAKAAAQMGITTTQFHRCVERGELPPAALNCRPLRWSVAQIEAWLIRDPSVPSASKASSAPQPEPRKQVSPRKHTDDPLMQVFADRLQALDDQ